MASNKKRKKNKKRKSSASLSNKQNKQLKNQPKDSSDEKNPQKGVRKKGKSKLNDKVQHSAYFSGQRLYTGGDSSQSTNNDSELRLGWLLNLTSFFFITFGIVIIYGGWFIARKFVPEINEVMSIAHSKIVVDGLLIGSLIVSAGVFFKVYELLYRVNSIKKPCPVPEAESTWFLKLAMVLFSGGACIILIAGFLQQHLIANIKPQDLAFSLRYIEGHSHRYLLSGLFFVLMAIFTQIYLIITRLSDECHLFERNN